MKTTPHRFDRSSHFFAAFLAAWCLLLLALPPTQGNAAVLTNVLVNNPAADATARNTQLETTIALGSGGAVFSAYVDTGSWDGTPGGADDHFIGLSLSLDGGANWLDMGPLPDTIRGDGVNPVLAHGLGVGALADAVYLATTDFDSQALSPSTLMFYKILGNSFPFVPNFMGMVNAASGPPGARIEHPSLAVDNFSPPMSGQGIVYLAWASNQNSIWLSRSFNGGNSFVDAIPLIDPPTPLHSQDFNAGDGGYTVFNPDNVFVSPWTHVPVDGSWQVNDDGANVPAPFRKTSWLTSPTESVTQPGAVRVSFEHRYSFELQGFTLFDGGNVQVSINGGPFIDVPAASFITGGYNGVVTAGSSSRLAGQPAFVGDSAGFAGPGFITSTIDLGFLAVGDTVAIRFQYAGDINLNGTFLPSWEVTSVLMTQGIGPERANGPSVVVGRDHSIYVFWLEQTVAGTTPNRIMMRRSNVPALLNDIFNPGVVVAALNPANTAIDGDLGLQGGFQGNSFPRALASQDLPGTLLVAYNDRGLLPGDRSDVFVQGTANFGVNWVQTRINDDPGANDQFNPTIAITPAGNNVLVSYYDRSRDTNNVLIDTFGRIFPNLLISQHSFRVTTESFPPVTDQDPGLPNTPGGELLASFMGSYDGAVADNDSFYYTWGDNRLAAPGVGQLNQPDVRFSRIPAGGPGGIIDLHHERITVGNRGAVEINGGNANNVIDPNECVALNIVLINRGNSNVVDVEAVLKSLTPGVIVSQTNSFYDDIAPGGSRTNVTPFSIVTAPSFVCGTFVDLELTVKTLQDGTFTIPIRLSTGVEGPFTRFTSLEPGTPIPDGAGYRDFINHVSGLTAPISSVKVRARITHASRRDLDLALEGPDGTTIVLSSDNGGTAENYGLSCDMPIVFDDTAATEITLAPAVNNLNGPFRPEQLLAAFRGKSGSAANGFWKLRVRDDSAGTAGDFVCWSLDITTATCTDGGGVCLNLLGARVNGGNLNGRLDPNECADLTVVLTNARAAAFLGVTSTLIPVTPGVTVVQPNSTYPDIPVNGTGANNTPFKVSIPSSIVCGQFVEFILRVTALNDGTFDVPLRLQVGSCLGTNFAAVNPQVPLTIPDGPAGTINSIIPVSGLLAPIGKVTVSVGIKHGFVRDLRLRLTSPGAVPVTAVLANRPDGGGDDFGLFSGPPGGPFTCLSPTTFDDAAGLSLADTAPPYGGTFRAEDPLFVFSGLSGADANGNWVLTIEDLAGGDVGQLVCWSLTICLPDSNEPVVGTLPSKIEDNVVNEISIPVSGITTAIKDVRLSLFIDHNNVGDVSIALISPDNTVVDLSSGNGGILNDYGFGCGLPTVFADDAPALITAGAAPFVGPFKPEQPLAAFAGKSGAAVNGNWRLRVSDNVGNAIEGSVECVLLDIFTAECTDGGGACPPNRTLTVGALNAGAGVAIAVSLADINMEQNGTTAFTRTYGNGASVDLTAPATAPNGNTFVRWRVGGVDQPPGQATVTVNLTGDRIVTAVYSGPTTLTVASVPVPGVLITVSPADNNALTDGTTTFTRQYNPLTTVTLTAPPMSPAGGSFVRWRIDGVDQTLGLAAVTVDMGASHTATAVYVGPSVLTVNSLAPASGVNVTVSPADLGGFTDGLTPFTRRYVFPGATLVTLTAPATAPNGFIFLRWRVDGVSQTPGLNPIAVVMSADHTVLAEYERPTRNLRVESDDPDSGVPIVATVDVNGNGNGVTTFTREYNKNTIVTLTAPLTEPGGRLFKKWEIDDDSQPQGQNTITVVMNADRKVEAKYMSATVELEIDSEDPDSGVDITVVTPDIFGRTSGTTEFKREYNRYSSVTLIAPPVADGKLFKRWEVDDDDQPTGQRVITVFMDEDIEVDAEYDDPVPAGATSFALWFDAFNDQARVPSSPSLRITGPITVEAWIRLDIGGIPQTIVEKSGCIGEAPLVGGYALGVNAANRLTFQTKDHCALASTVTGGTSLAPGTWYHVAGLWNGAELRVYINGVLDGTLADLRNPKLGDTPLLIGSSGNSVPFQTFAGFIDEVRVWSVTRSAADLTANMGGCLTGSQPGLAGYWRLNENNTVVIHDSSINGNNGLLSGAILAGSPVACALPSPLPIVAPRAAPAPPAALRLTMSPDMSGHTCKLMVTGDAGKMTLIEVSKDLQNWAPLVCCTNVTGAFEISDPMDPGVTKRFFRVRQEP